jgi:hypothetical protein
LQYYAVSIRTALGEVAMWKGIVTGAVAVAIATTLLAQQQAGRAPRTTQSNDTPPSTTGRAQPQAPVGHRQPGAADVPNGGGSVLSPGELKLDQSMKICRGC